jgi:lysophospholipase L1-like esterase
VVLHWLRLERERCINLALLLGSSAFALICFGVFDFVTSQGQHSDPATLPNLRSNGRNLYINKANGWYELNANYRGEDRYGPHRFAVATDGNGFRIDPSAAARPAAATAAEKDMPALLFLGDSFTYGVASPWSNSFVGQVARRYPGRVINAGVNSHSPTPHLYRLRRLLNDGTVPARAMVIMAVDISDVQDEASRWQPGPTEPGDRSSQARAANASQQVIARQSSSPDSRSDRPFFSARNFQLSHRLYYALEGVYKRFFDHWQVRNNVRSAFTHRPWPELEPQYQPLGVAGGLQQLRQQIQAAAQLSHSSGHRFLLLIYPWPAQLAYPEPFNWEQWISASCQAPNCSGVINAFPAFRQQVGSDRSAAAWQERLYLRGDMHLNAAGNALVAQAILDTLQQR